MLAISGRMNDDCYAGGAGQPHEGGHHYACLLTVLTVDAVGTTLAGQARVVRSPPRFRSADLMKAKDFDPTP